MENCEQFVPSTKFDCYLSDSNPQTPALPAPDHRWQASRGRPCAVWVSGANNGPKHPAGLLPNVIRWQS